MAAAEPGTSCSSASTSGDSFHCSVKEESSLTERDRGPCRVELEQGMLKRFGSHLFDCRSNEWCHGDHE